MKLYSRPLSPYAARVRGAFYAKGLEFTAISPPDNWGTDPAYLAVNPLGKIPALVLEDGKVLVESGVIVEFLEDAYPTPSLRPSRPEDLAQVRVITQVAELYVVPAIMPMFELFEASPRNQTAIEAGLARLHKGLATLESLLKPDDYAFGGALTTADLWLTPMRFILNGLAGFGGLPTLLAPYPAIDAYAGVVQRDPVLARVWQEMTDGLQAFMAARAAG